MPYRLWACNVAWITCLIASSAVAQGPESGFLRTLAVEAFEESDVGTRWALLVGISEYPEAEGFTISRLQGPAKDVENLQELLTDPERGGFPPENVRTLVDAQATRDAIHVELNDIGSRAKADDLTLFYFSGHGLPADDAGRSSYLVPYFTHPRALSDPTGTCIEYEDLRRKLEDEMPANKVVMLLDACHAGGIKRAGSRAVSQQEIYQRALEVFRDAQGVVMILSSREAEESLDEPDGGVFTRFLVAGLEGQADEDGDFLITIDELATYVRQEVPEYARRKFGREQNPTLRYGNAPVQGKIPLAIDLPALEKEEEARLRLRDRRYDEMFDAFRDDPALRDWTMALADREVIGGSLTDDEAEILRETDRLLNRETTADAYRRVAGVIYRRIHPSEAVPPPTLRLTVIAAPTDTTLALIPTETPEQVVSPESTAPGRTVYRTSAGSYRLTAQREGYAADTHAIELAADESRRVTLAKLMGRLHLDVTPTGADISVAPVAVAEASDVEARTVVVGPTAETQRLPIGTYRVSAEMGGYTSASRSPVVVRPNETTPVELRLTRVQTLAPVQPSPEPAPTTAHIAYPGMPKETKVFLDGAPATLPQTVTVESHEIRLERPGYRPVIITPDLVGRTALELQPAWISLPRRSGPPRGGAFLASLAVPGLGQHLAGRHVRGFRPISTI